MQEMSSRERVMHALNHRKPDRTPIFEYVMHPAVGEVFIGRSYREYQEEPQLWLAEAEEKGLEATVMAYVQARLDLAEYFSHDMLYIAPNPVPGEVNYYDPLEAIGSRFIIRHEGSPEERLAERNEQVRELLLKKLPQDCFLVYHLLRKEMDRRGLDLPVLAPAYFHGIWTDTDLMQTMLLAPDAAADHFSLATERALHLIADYCSMGIELIGIGGDFAGNRMLISGECYRQFIVPEVRKCADFIRSKGSYSVNATDGNIWPVIDDFLMGCGVDCYLEIDMKAGMDLWKLKALYGSEITFLGNMDCGAVLTFASPEEIAEITNDILSAGCSNTLVNKGYDSESSQVGGGHIFTASNAIMGSVPVDNYLAMVNAYKRRFSLV